MSYTPTKISSASASVVPYENATPTATKWVSPGGGSSATGTSSSPYGTIQAAVNASAPGTAIMVKAGTYTENVKLTKSGTTGAPIWLASADGEGAATIKAANASASAVYGHGVDNVVVQGFKVTGATEGFNVTQGGTGLTNMAQNIVIEDNTVFGHSVDGIKTSQTQNSAIVGNKVYNIGTQEGIDNVYMRNGVIANNDVSDVRGLSGIVAKAGSDNVRITGNDVSGVRDGILVGGMSSGQGSTFPSGIAYEARNFTVSGNTVAGNTKAVTVYGGQDSVIRDNVLKTGSTWVASVGTDNLGYVSKGIQFVDNDVSKSNWLTAAAGSVSVNSGNVVIGSASPPPAGAPAPSPSPTPTTIPTVTATWGWGDSAASTRTITGTSAADTLTGTTAAEKLDGLGGIDRMTGGSGDDRYIAGSRYDVAVESSGGGRDTVLIYDAAYTLPANVENLSLMRGAGVRDNSLNNVLTASSGADTFAFSTAHGNDLIRGFNPTADVIKVDGRTASSMEVAQTPSGDMVLQHDGASITLAGISAKTPVADLF